MIGLLHRETAKAGKHVMSAVASGAAYLNAFTPLENLSTLRVLPGSITDDLGDEVSQRETMQNSSLQARNVVNTLSISDGISSTPILLVDDILDSG